MSCRVSAELLRHLWYLAWALSLPPRGMDHPGRGYPGALWDIVTQGSILLGLQRKQIFRKSWDQDANIHLRLTNHRLALRAASLQLGYRVLAPDIKQLGILWDSFQSADFCTLQLASRSFRVTKPQSAIYLEA